MDERDLIDAVEEDGLALGGAEGDVEDGAVLGDVDLLAGEHGLDAGFETRLLGELGEELEGLVGDAVLGVVEEDATELGGVAGSASGIVGEELAELLGLEGGVVVGEGLPGGALAERCDGCGHSKCS